MTLLLACFFCGSAIADPGIRTDRGVYPEPVLPVLPSAGGHFTDPTFGTTIIRVTDESDGNNNLTAYSYWPTLNSDSTRLHVNTASGPKRYLFDPATLELTYDGSLYQGSAPPGGFPRWEDSIWSATDPDLIYGHQGTKLISYNLATNNYTVLKDFSDAFPPQSDANYIIQMSKSADDQRFAFSLNSGSPNWSRSGYAAWDRQTDTVLLHEESTFFDEVQIDKTGQYLVIKTGNSGAGVVEVQIADLDGGTIEDLTDDSPDSSPGHSDNGRGTVVGADNWNNRITFRELDDPHNPYTVISYGSDWSQASHISMLADDEDWVTVSKFVANSFPQSGVFTNEIFMVSTDGSEELRRFVHHRSVYNSYWDSPRANISSDGRFVAFTSNWGDSGRRDVFIVRTFIPVAGDANGDGKVDGTDLAVWQLNYDPLGVNAATNDFITGDWDDDGRIDGTDLALWQLNYDPLGTIHGASLEGGGGLETVPEPATIGLLLMGGVAVLLRGRSSRRRQQLTP